MENGLSILLLWFSAALFLYAGFTALTKTVIVPYRIRATMKIKNKPRYAVQFAKGMALVALSPLLAGGIGLLTDSPAVAGVIFFIIRIFRKRR